MHDTALDAASQSRAQSGDVDSNGDLVDALTRRLEEAIGEDAEEARELQREGILRELRRFTAAREPGLRLVDGELLYSAAWLDAEPSR